MAQRVHRVVAEIVYGWSYPILRGATGFAPDPNCSYEDTSERRTLTQEYMNAVDWTEPIATPARL